MFEKFFSLSLSLSLVSQVARASNASAELFVGGLPVQLTSESLGQYFAQFGNVVSAEVVRNKQTGASKCFGFVAFASHQEAYARLSRAFVWSRGKRVKK